MNKQKRVNQIIASMTSCQKSLYTREEELEELLKLQTETIEIAFSNQDRASLDRARIWDVLDNLKQKNLTVGGKANKEIEIFAADCKNLSWQISGALIGIKGEEKVLRRLQYKECPGKFLRNLHLSDGEQSIKLDLMVITDNAVFMIETKNTRLDVYIDEVGDQYRIKNSKHFDTKLKDKMDLREKLIKKTLANAGVHEVEVIGIVCYTDSSITIDNRCETLTTCTLGKLPYLIINHNSSSYIPDATRDLIAATLNEASHEERHLIHCDTQAFKRDFALAMATIEEAQKRQKGLLSRAKNFLYKFLNTYKAGNPELATV